MTKEETKTIVEKYYDKPVLETWEPSDYDLKYKYKGAVMPKQVMKLNAEREKQNAKLRAKFDAETARYEGVFRALDRVEKYPAEVASMLFSLVKMAVDDITRRHEAHLEARRLIKKTFGQTGLDVYSSARHLFRVKNYWHGGPKWKYPEITDELWKTLDEHTRRNFHQVSEDKWDYEHPALEIGDREGYAKAVLETVKFEDYDEIYDGSRQPYADAVSQIAGIIVSVADEIERLFGGRVPDRCETGPRWGVGGKFNAVLAAGDDRISFCSFCAGGWNIQRFHYRYKVTKLK